jgi:hypothetical protein
VPFLCARIGLTGRHHHRVIDRLACPVRGIMKGAAMPNRSNKKRAKGEVSRFRPEGDKLLEYGDGSSVRQVWYEHIDERRALALLLQLYRERMDNLKSVAAFSDNEHTGMRLNASVVPSDTSDADETPRRGRRRRFETLHNDRPWISVALQSAGFLSQRLGKSNWNGDVAELAKAAIGFLELTASHFRDAAKRLRSDMKKHPELYEKLPTLAEFMAATEDKKARRKRAA